MALLKNCSVVEESTAAHDMEHSLEVQVPFLQYLKSHVKIVPILIGSGRYDSLKTLGQGLSKTIAELGRDTLIVASSDMSHTDSSNAQKQKRISELDREAIKRFKLTNKFTHVSTGGGASLMLWQGTELPAVKALKQSYRKFKNKF